METVIEYVRLKTRQPHPHAVNKRGQWKAEPPNQTQIANQLNSALNTQRLRLVPSTGCYPVSKPYPAFHPIKGLSIVFFKIYEPKISNI